MSTASLFLHILPLALGAAISPALLAASLELLVQFGRRGRRMLALYLLGAASVVAVVVALSLVLPPRPATSDSVLSDVVDVVLAGILLVIAAVLLFRRPDRTKTTPEKPGLAKRLLGSRWVGAGVLGLGVFMMVTNFSTLVLLLAGSHEVSSANVDPVAQGLAYGLLAFGALLPILLPLVWVLVRPTAATRELGRVDEAIGRHGRMLGILVSLLTAAYLLARGFGLI